MFVNKLFAYLTCAISKRKTCFYVKSLRYYLHVKTNILADFQICISVPLISCAKPAFLQIMTIKYKLKIPKSVYVFF